MDEIIIPEVDIGATVEPPLSTLNEELIKEQITMEAHHNNECLEVGLEGMSVAQRIGLDSGARSERIGFAELGAIDRVGNDVCGATRDVISEVHAVDNHLNNSVERHGLYNAGVTQSTSDKTQAEVERFGLSELDAIRGSEKYLYAGMSENAKDILLQAANNTASIKQALCEDSKDLLLQACNNTDKIMSQSASQFKDILLQNCNDTAEIKMQAEVLGKDAALAARDLMHQADKNTAAIQLEAFRNKEELARQIAECCCEQKALTLETSHKTQDVVREVEDRRVRDELARTREELIALRVRSTLLPALTGSVPL